MFVTYFNKLAIFFLFVSTKLYFPLQDNSALTVLLNIIVIFCKVMFTILKHRTFSFIAYTWFFFFLSHEFEPTHLFYSAEN